MNDLQNLRRKSCLRGHIAVTRRDALLSGLAATLTISHYGGLAHAESELGEVAWLDEIQCAT